jgi:hypothetical protein
LLERAGFCLDSIEDLTEVAAREFEDLLAALSAKRLDGVTTDERRGWELEPGALTLRAPRNRASTGDVVVRDEVEHMVDTAARCS